MPALSPRRSRSFHLQAAALWMLGAALFTLSCSAPGAPAPSPVGKQPGADLRCEGARDNLCELFHFAGLAYGDDAEAVLRLLGPANHIERNDGRDGGKVYDWETWRYYTDDKNQVLGDLSLNIDKATRHVRVIHLRTREGVLFLRSRGVEDGKLDLYSQHKDLILDRFGPPDDIHAGFHEYRFRNAAGKGLVTFICYEQEGGHCNDIWLTWFYR